MINKIYHTLDCVGCRTKASGVKPFILIGQKLLDKMERRESFSILLPQLSQFSPQQQLLTMVSFGALSSSFLFLVDSHTQKMKGALGENRNPFSSYVTWAYNSTRKPFMFWPAAKGAACLEERKNQEDNKKVVVFKERIV